MSWKRRSVTPASEARRREYASPAYRRARAAAKRVVDKGEAYCWRPECRRWLDPDRPWHMGHDDDDRTVLRGPECPPCNLKAAASKGAKVANRTRRVTRIAM